MSISNRIFRIDLLRIAYVFGAIFVVGSFAIAADSEASNLPRTILFIDDDDILYRPGTIKHVVEFKKPSLDPVIPPDKLWEGMIGWTSVYRNPETGKYQLWYQAYQERRKEDKSLKCIVCYAESDDGLHWIKPDLGLFPFYDETKTNIVLIGAGGKKGGYGDRYCNSVLVDTNEKDSAKRYKMAYYDWNIGEGKDGGAGTHVAFSPDGIRWTKHEGGSVSKTALGGKGTQFPFADDGPYSENQLKDGSVRRSWMIPIAMSDALDTFYDPRRKAYVAYGKMWTPWPDGGASWKHGMGRMESQDFIHWSKPELILTVNDRDPPHVEFHTSPVFPYGPMYLSLNQLLDRAAGTIDIELMSSRDGIRWDRTFANTWVIPRGPADRFDAGTIVSNGTPILLENEIRFYYGAYRGTAMGAVGLNRQELGSKDYFSGVGLATTPRDRFVAVGPNPKSPVKGQKKGQPQLVNTIGQVTLRPQELSNVKSIRINADASHGAIYVEILNEDGFRLRGFAKEDALAIVGDGLTLEASWKDKRIETLPEGRYQIRIHLDRAELYGVSLLP